MPEFLAKMSAFWLSRTLRSQSTKQPFETTILALSPKAGSVLTDHGEFSTCTQGAQLLFKNAQSNEFPHWILIPALCLNLWTATFSRALLHKSQMSEQLWIPKLEFKLSKTSILCLDSPFLYITQGRKPKWLWDSPHVIMILFPSFRDHYLLLSVH